MRPNVLRFEPDPPEPEPSIPLGVAALCVDCERIVRNDARCCPACGSHILVLVQPFVDGAK